MAEDIREVLGRYVPEAVLDEALDAVKSTEIAPKWFQDEVAKIGADAKEAKQLRAELESIKSAPKRKEALARVGIDYDAVPKYGQKALDELPVEDLDDLDKVAQYVQEQGFEANLQTEEAPKEQSGAEQIVNFTSSVGPGGPVKGKLTPADFASWDHAKQRDFIENKPREYEAIKRGEEVPS